ncbi:MAG: M23 family metallopeptidase [Gilvibacter sp.]
MRLLICLLFLNGIMFGQDLALKKTITNDSVYIDLINLLYAPVQAEYRALDSVKGQIKVLPKSILASRDTLKSIVVVPQNLVKDTAVIDLSQYAALEAQLGDPAKAVHDSFFPYALPYSKKKRIKIIQTFNGGFSHNEPTSKYAVDFATQIGDTIYAARDGVVVKTRDDFTEHGGREMIDAANLVILLHDDGTFAHYLHLDYKGVLVAPGAQVKKGEAIGISGWTGFSTLPHLHFAIIDANNRSVPFYFEGYQGVILKKGKRYKHK